MSKEQTYVYKARWVFGRVTLIDYIQSLSLEEALKSAEEKAKQNNWILKAINRVLPEEIKKEESS